MDKTLLLITGPTAVGKTDISIDIAKKYNTEIISCDSRQFYKELNIGTAVPNLNQLNEVKHHFIQHISIHDYYNVSMYENDVIDLLKKLFVKNNIVILTGGSGLYIDAVCKGIDDMPNVDFEIRKNLQEKLEQEGIQSLRFELKKIDEKTYNNIDLKNSKRILRALEVFYQTGKKLSDFKTAKNKKRDFKIVKVCLNINREKLYDKINKRVDIMINRGLIEEAKTMYEYKNLIALKTVGYKELFEYFEEKITLEKAIELIKRNTRHYARKQLTWFRKDNEINWFDLDNDKLFYEFVQKKISEK